MSYIPSWCKMEIYTRHLLERTVSKCSKNISGWFHKKQTVSKALAESKQYNKFKPLFRNKKQDNQSRRFDCGLWSPIQHMQSVKVNIIKTQYGK